MTQPLVGSGWRSTTDEKLLSGSLMGRLKVEYVEPTKVICDAESLWFGHRDIDIVRIDPWSSSYLMRVSSGHFGDSFNTHKTTNHHSSSSDSRKGSGIGFYGLDASRSGVPGDSRPKPGVTYSANKPGGSTFSSPHFGTDAFAEDKNTEFDFPESDKPITSADKPRSTTFSADKPVESSHSNDKSGGSPFDEDSSSDDDFSEFEFKKLDSDSDNRRGVSTFSDEKPAVSTGFDKDTSRYSTPEVNELPKPDAFRDSYKPETVSSYSAGQQGFTSGDKSQSGRFQNVPDFKGPQISFKMGSTATSASDAAGFSGKILSRPFYGGYASGGQVKTQFLGMRPSVLYAEEPSYFSGTPAVSLRNKIFYLTDDSVAGAYDYSSPSLLYSGNEGAVLLDAAHDSDSYVLVKKK
ncbi:hypothetical protein TNCV_17221 [Trichonephila clavipes]|nr:hypothetical protein TNCV_17221 [Trichonephila clavipes]